MKLYVLGCALSTFHILNMKKPTENTLCHFVLTPYAFLHANDLSKSLAVVNLFLSVLSLTLPR